MPDYDSIGVIVVDHGSRREQSNEMLLHVVAMFREHSHFSIIEPAHMELAEPSLETAFARCVQQGAQQIIVHPYFLLPGRHSKRDIPKLASKAAARHDDLAFRVTEPLGVHPLMAQIIEQRINDCLGD